LQTTQDDSEELEETYEIDLGELTEDEPAGTSSGLTRDPWQTGNSAPDEAGVQAYDINVDELFVDADMGLAPGTSPGNGVPMHEGWPSPDSSDSGLWPTLDEDGGRGPSTFIEDPTPARPAVSASPEPVQPSGTSSASPKQSGRPEWLDMVESLRNDVQQLQTDWGAPTMIGPNLSVSQLDNVPDQAAHFETEMAALPVSAPAPEKPRAKGKNPRPAKKKKHPRDEWGFFDPEQCGFAALLTKLEEITDDDAFGS